MVISFIISFLIGLIPLGILVTPRIYGSTYYTTNDALIINSTDYSNKDELKIQIAKLMNTKHSYQENILPENVYGRVSILSRSIEISSKPMPNIMYIITYTHELCHIKYFTMDERYVQYKTFVHLYESVYFKDAAIYHYWLMLSGGYSKEYNASDSIYKYLISKNINLFEVTKI